MIQAIHNHNSRLIIRSLLFSQGAIKATHRVSALAPSTDVALVRILESTQIISNVG